MLVSSADCAFEGDAEMVDIGELINPAACAAAASARHDRTGVNTELLKHRLVGLGKLVELRHEHALVLEAEMRLEGIIGIDSDARGTGRREIDGNPIRLLVIDRGENAFSVGPGHCLFSLRRDQVARALDRCRRALTIAVCADPRRKIIVDWGPADHDLDIEVA